ncbi:MAG TPA: hypothetical protein VF668_20500 [Pyrinomonadaceae bacterium]
MAATQTRAQSHAQAGAQQGASPTAAATAPAATARAGEGPLGSRIPIRVTRVETPDGPGVLATIGEFPEDLSEGGQEFLKREFFERFASDVLGLGEAAPARAMLKVAMLPQEKENQREGDFIFGKVSGHMVVLVEKRRVLIACTFAETEQKPQLMAALKAWRAGV